MRTWLVIGLLVLMTGCVGNARVGPYGSIEGDPESLRAMFEGLNGVIKTGKESADAKSEYFAARNKREEEITKRETSPSFLSQLFGLPTNGTRE